MNIGKMAKDAARLALMATIMLFVSLLFSNIIFNFVYDHFIAYVSYGDTYSLAALVTIGAISIIFILLGMFAYWLFQGHIVEAYIQGDEGKHLQKLTEVQSKLDSHDSRLSDLNHQLSAVAGAINENAMRLAAQVENWMTITRAANLISEPSAYGDIIAHYAAQANSPKELTFVGTMAGFSFTVGRSLSEYLAKVSDFERISIFTTSRLNAHEKEDTIVYVLFFVLSTIREYLRSSENLASQESKSWLIEIGYMNRDLFSAAIFIPSKECIVLPALKNSALKAIATVGGTPLLGLRYHESEPQGKPIYERYDEVIRGHADRYIGRSQGGTAEGNKPVPETWTIEYAEDSWSISVKAPRWSVNRSSISTLHDISSVESEKELKLAIGNHGEAATSLDDLIKKVLQTPGAGKYFNSLLTAADSSPTRPRYAFNAL